MKLLLEWVKNSKHWFKTLTKYVEKGVPVEVLKINMAGRKIEDSTDIPPNKKLCIDAKNEVTPKEKKIKNRNIALLLAYLGDDYSGLQVNTSVRTIEGELLSALCKAEVIPPGGVSAPSTIKFQRTARTDKGVSAAKQVISLKMAEHYSIESINKYLPEDIKVLSAKKVTKRFNCKNDCTGRTYSYTLPTFALAPELHTEYPEKYRINEEALQKANEIFLSYKGTHNFHNFTVKKFYMDPSAKRFIMNLDIEKPFLNGEEEFVTLKVKGQSFMFHQIRKMVGHMIAVIKGIAPKDIQTEIWTDKKFSVPLAPGLGLLLEDVHFDRYDRKFGNDGIHETLNWDEISDEVNKFRSYILSRIIEKETERKAMFNWLLVLCYHNYDSDRSMHCAKNPEEVHEEGDEDEKILATNSVQ